MDTVKCPKDLSRKEINDRFGEDGFIEKCAECPYLSYSSGLVYCTIGSYVK